MIFDSWIERLRKGKAVEVAYGYPPYKKTWLTIYRREKSGEFIFEWDDLFADERPKSYELNASYMYFKKGVTEDIKQQAINHLGARIW